MLATHDLVGLEAEVDELEIGDGERETLLRPPEPARRARGARARPASWAAGRWSGRPSALPRPTRRCAARGRRRAGQLDLGLLRDLGYYTGAILEVYDPALGHVLGGGGRYDELMGRFGRPLPAAGFALYLERVHMAQAEEQRVAQETAREGGRGGGDASRAPPGR